MGGRGALRRVAVGLLAAGLAAWASGCGSSQATAFNRLLSGVVNESEFTVAQGERVGCQGDVTIRCRTANIAGVLTYVAASRAGQVGGNLLVEAEQTISVTGSIATGGGAAGATDAAGGDGGDLTLRAGGAVTLGGASSRQSNDAVLAAGDGANGGDGLLGGAGGDGGSVAITAAGQTVTLHESPGFIHLGDGGAGGTGVVGGQALLVFEVPEQVPSAGGGSGHLVVDAAVVAGVPAGEPVLDSQGQSHPTFVLAADSVTGGDGGDGGDWHYGVAPGSEASTWPSNRGPSVGRVGTSPVAVRGANGGDAEFQGGNGGDARVVRSGQAVGAGADAGDVTAVGGNGGDARNENLLAFELPAFGKKAYGGNGGDALADAANGGAGAPGNPGGRGGAAGASGGRGGDSMHLGALATQSFPGHGGHAKALGGWGGQGGDLTCPASRPGARGGPGGLAAAVGGDGGEGWQFVELSRAEGPNLGAGGNARSQGGDGGRGGVGFLGGPGGGAGTTAATKGKGTPDGTATAVPGAAGGTGAECSRPSRTDTYKAVVGGYNYVRYQVVYQVVVDGMRQTGGQLGGPVNPLFSFYGQSMAMNADGSILWVCHQGDLRVYRNPLTGGDRPPDFLISDYVNTVPGSPYVQSLWYDQTSDTLFTGNVFIYRNASQITGPRAPDVSYSVTYLGMYATPVYDAQRDRLFLSNADELGMVENPLTRSGNIQPDAELNDATVMGDEMGEGRGLAYDPVRDEVYFGYTKSGVGKEVRVVPGPPWNPLPAVRRIAGIGGLPDALRLFSDTDVLVVSTRGAGIKVFDRASTRDENSSTPTATAGSSAAGFFCWRESVVQ